MISKIIINYFLGFAFIKVEGYYVERFMNCCIKSGIFMWSIDRKKMTIVYAKTGLENISKIREIAPKFGCEVSIKKQKGFPILIEKCKKRKAFVFSFLIVCVVILQLSTYIWNIEIDGLDKIQEAEIIKYLEEKGVKTGVLKRKLNINKIIEEIRTEREDIAWIGIEFEGTNARVRISEASKKPEIIDEKEFCNIVASKDATIKKISAQNGTIIAKEGDKVKKGDILIAGWMQGNVTDKYYVNSQGSVLANVIYSQTVKIQKNTTERVKTGKKNKKIAIKFNNFKINFYKVLSKFENYDTIITTKKIKFFSNFYLPINIINYENSEVKIVEKKFDYESAKAYGETEAKKKLDEKINGEIKNSIVDVKEYDGYFDVTVTYDVIEEIGTKEKIEL